LNSITLIITKLSTILDVFRQKSQYYNETIVFSEFIVYTAVDRNIKTLVDAHYTRRRPKQKRSIEKLNRILDAATLLMTSPNEEKLTTSKIATKAGIAVGSIYQFFSNVEEIKEALLMRVISRVSLVYKKVIREVPEGTSVKELANALIDATADFPNSYPVIVNVITASTLNKEFLTVKKQTDKILLKMFTKIIITNSQHNDRNEVRRWLATLILIGDTMTHQIWTAKSEESRQLFIVEWKELAGFYLDYHNV